jgi:Transposase DDE domain
MFFRRKRVNGLEYLQIVKNERVDGRHRQSVVATIGRADQLDGTGTLDRLLRSGVRLCENAVLLSAVEAGEVPVGDARRIGAPLVFERLWRETQCRAVIEGLAGERDFAFPVERAVFLTVLHRLMDPGSDRAAERWRDGYGIDGMSDIDLHRLYRAMGWLGEPLADQSGCGLAPRTTKDLVEEQLFERRRSLFNPVGIAIFDTTSLYFEGEGGATLGRHGHSKDHRPDLKQMVLGVVIDASGRPLCSELWPGNTTDVTTLLPVIDRLRQRFLIDKVCVVADRGMISAATMAELETRGIDYILGVRERATKAIRDVIADPAPSVPLSLEKAAGRGSTDLLVKEVVRSGVSGDGTPWRHRYIVCRNEAEARKDKAERDAILAALEDALRRGDKSLIGNRGYRRFLSVKPGRHFAIDPRRVALDAVFDGTYVLRTNTTIAPLRVALRYRDRWIVEDIFRTAKSLLATRPIFHKCDDTIRGHVFCSFLALVLRKELQDRLAAAGRDLEWAHVITDLDRLVETEILQDDKRFLIRPAAPGCAGQVFQAVGVALPPMVRHVSQPPPDSATPRPRARRKRRIRGAKGRAPADNLLI